MEATKLASPEARRRAAWRARILDAAWELARRDGVATISLRDIAAMVDLRQPSLYTYFASKADLYDAMFAQGFQALLDQRRQLEVDLDPAVMLREGCQHFLEFCVRDPARFQLLFQHSIPGFHPSEETMKLSSAALGQLQQWLADAGADGKESLDLMRALLVGLAAQQVANEPGGSRWTRLVDQAVDAVLVVATQRRTRIPTRRATTERTRTR